MQNFKISASILSANFADLGRDTAAVLAAGADWVHFDVMDNHYVPNLTMGPMFCKALRQYGIEAPIDVHLMVKPVDRLIESFAKAGANYITIHPEATEHLDRSLQHIRDAGCKAGIAFNPATPITCLPYILDKLDMILIMSVNPGFSNQTFIQSALLKIQEVRALLKDNYSHIRLEVDGGVKLNNIKKIAQAGADTFVMGSAIFDTQDYATTLAQFKQELIG